MYREFESHLFRRDTEEWLSGLKHRFAKPSYADRRTVGSNPTSSANTRLSSVYDQHGSGKTDTLLSTTYRSVVDSGY